MRLKVGRQCACSSEGTKESTNPAGEVFWDKNFGQDYTLSRADGAAIG
jgi:hypothetical protein